jgi:hypothetical protein
VDVTALESAGYPVHNAHTITNLTGAALDYDTHVRIPAGTTVFAVTENGIDHAYSYAAATGRVHVAGALATGVHAPTSVRVYFGTRGDADGDGDIDLDDFPDFPACMTGPGGDASAACAVYDFEPDGDVDLDDYARFAELIGQ